MVHYRYIYKTTVTPPTDIYIYIGRRGGGGGHRSLFKKYWISFSEDRCSLSKQCIPWWNAALCCILSRSSLFARVPIQVFKGLKNFALWPAIIFYPGVYGIVRDKQKKAINGTTIKIDQQVHTLSPSVTGEFYFILTEGKHVLEFSAPGRYTLFVFVFLQ